MVKQMSDTPVTREMDWGEGDHTRGDSSDAGSACQRGGDGGKATDSLRVLAPRLAPAGGESRPLVGYRSQAWGERRIPRP